MEFKKIKSKKFVLLGLILLFCCVGVFGGIEMVSAAPKTCSVSSDCNTNNVDWPHSDCLCGSCRCDGGYRNCDNNWSNGCERSTISGEPCSGSCSSQTIYYCFDDGAAMCGDGCWSVSQYTDCSYGNGHLVDCACPNACTGGSCVATIETCAEACVADGYDKGSCITGSISCDSGKCGYPTATDCIYKCTDKSGTACTKTCTCYDMDKNCGSTQAECIADCKAEGCAAAGCPGVGETDPHNACVAGACESVSGCGVSDCSACSGCPACTGHCCESPKVCSETATGTCASGVCCVSEDKCTSSGGTCANPDSCSNTPPCYCDPDLVEHCGASPGSVFCDNCCPWSGMSSCGLCGATPPPTCSPPCVSPQTCVCAGGVCACKDPGAGGSTIWPVTFTNPLDVESFEELIASVINWLLAIVGSIVLLFIIIAGIMYMTAAGDEAQLTRAKKMLFYTILGFAIILISYSLIKEIKDILGIVS